MMPMKSNNNFNTSSKAKIPKKSFLVFRSERQRQVEIGIDRYGKVDRSVGREK